MGLAVGVTIALGQLLRCLHPPAGAVALLGVMFSRVRPGDDPYPNHWF
jgi:CBS-domain-containing membrane protein